jgi:hypothetical protein
MLRADADGTAPASRATGPAVALVAQATRAPISKIGPIHAAVPKARPDDDRILHAPRV